MSNEKNCLIPMIEQKIASDDITDFKKSRRIRIIINLIYLISLLDFLLHYALMVEMNVFQQIYQTFGKISEPNSTAISLCELPIKKYLSFSLTQMSLYILYLSILALLLSTEAMRRSSSQLYRFYIIIKFIFAMTFLSLCTIHALVNRRMTFIQTSLIIPHDSAAITIDTCLIYAREKMAIYILAIFNVLIFLISMECSKVFSFLK
jgi:hypothetical protein